MRLLRTSSYSRRDSPWKRKRPVAPVTLQRSPLAPAHIPARSRSCRQAGSGQLDEAAKTHPTMSFSLGERDGRGTGFLGSSLFYSADVRSHSWHDNKFLHASLRSANKTGARCSRLRLSMGLLKHPQANEMRALASRQGKRKESRPPKRPANRCDGCRIETGAVRSSSPGLLAPGAPAGVTAC